MNILYGYVDDSASGEQPKQTPHNDYLDVLNAQVYGASSVIEGEHTEEFVAKIGQGLMLKSRTTYHRPPTSRAKKVLSLIRKKWG